MTDIKSGLVRHVAAGQVRLAYRTWGPAQAPPLVLLHALGDDSSDWALVATALSPSWRVYAPDLRGHGASDWPGAYTIEQLSADLAAFLDALGLERVALGGHSIGAVPAFLLAARQDRPAGPLSFDWGAMALSNEFTAAQVSPWRDSLRRIQAPALLVAGGPASHVDQGQLADMAGLIPDCELLTIPAGHLVHAARPADFTAAVSAFLDQPRLGTGGPGAPSPEGPHGRRLASHRAPGRTYGKRRGTTNSAI